MLHGLLRIAFLAPIVLLLAGSVLVAALYPALRPRLSRVHPSRRRSLLLGVVFAPVIAAVGLTAVAFVPSVAGSLWPALDHCPLHGVSGHPHLCFWHSAIHTPSTGAWIFAAGVLGVAGAFGAQQAFRLFAALSLVRRFRSLARYDVGLGASIVTTPAPLALSSGAFIDGVCVSTGLIKALSPEQLDIVLAHERQHVARRDPLWRGIAAIVSAVHLPSARGMILADLHLACEQACDEVAARFAGNRALVAKTILEVSKLIRAHGESLPQSLSGFGGHDVPARLESLLEDEPVAGPPAPSLLWWWGGPAMVPLAEPFHHGIETLLAVFVK